MMTDCNPKSLKTAIRDPSIAATWEVLSISSRMPGG